MDHFFARGLRRNITLIELIEMMSTSTTAPIMTAVDCSSVS